MLFIPTTYARHASSYLSCLENFRNTGSEILRINCTRLSLDRHIEQIVRIKQQAPDFKFLLDIPYPGTKPRIKFKWPVPDHRIAQKVGDDTNFFRVEKGEIAYFVREYLPTLGEIQFIISDTSYSDWLCVGDTVYVSENPLRLTVVRLTNDYVELQALTSGFVAYNKAIYTDRLNKIDNKNFLQYKILLDEINPKMVALSFVENAEQVKKFHEICTSRSTQIWAKIETPRAIDNIDEIVSCSHGIIVGRGDLLLNSSYGEFAYNVERILRAANNKKPVIIATGLFSSIGAGNYVPQQSELTELHYYLNNNVAGFIFNYKTAHDLVAYRTVTQIIRQMIPYSNYTMKHIVDQVN